MANKKVNINQLRSLKQYRDMTDEEFADAMEEKVLNIESSDVFEKRIEEKLKLFAEDYDLSDLKINDREQLRALIQAIISLEDYEQALFRIRGDGITVNNLSVTKELQKAMSDLRSDISRIQDDLNIKRKVRKSDKDQSALAYIDSLKENARKFYESRMTYIFCPKCNMLLATFWCQYPEEDKNKMSFVCGRKLENGNVCGEKIIISPKEIYEDGTNNKKIMPEAMR